MWMSVTEGAEWKLRALLKGWIGFERGCGELSCSVGELYGVFRVECRLVRWFGAWWFSGSCFGGEEVDCRDNCTSSLTESRRL